MTPVTYAQAEQMKQEDENNITAAENKEPQKKNMFNTREADERIAEFYKQAGGI